MDDSRAAWRNLTLDMRNFRRLKMFLHAEKVGLDLLFDKDVSAFIRIGSDYTSNYYEYEIPLKLTDWGSSDPSDIWPDENIIRITLDSLPYVKQLRNIGNHSATYPFSISNSSRRITVIGNPDLGRVKTMMVGIRNPKKEDNIWVADDTGEGICAEVWFNELSLEGFDERGGSAALARVDLQLADLGNISVSGNMHTIGFGGIEQSVSERYRDDFYQYDASSSLDVGKLLPKSLGLNLPVFASISESFSNPQFDPYDSDIELTEKLALVENDANLTEEEKDERKRFIKDEAQTYTGNKSFNLSNIRFGGNKAIKKTTTKPGLKVAKKLRSQKKVKIKSPSLPLLTLA